MTQPKLKYHNSNYKELFDHDLDEFVEQIYGKSWSFWAAMEGNRGCYYRFSVKKEKIDEYDEEQLQSWLYDVNSNEPSAWLILQDLCNKGFIDEGNRRPASSPHSSY